MWGQEAVQGLFICLGDILIVLLKFRVRITIIDNISKSAILSYMVNNMFNKDINLIS